MLKKTVASSYKGNKMHSYKTHLKNVIMKLFSMGYFFKYIMPYVYGKRNDLSYLKKHTYANGIFLFMVGM